MKKLKNSLLICLYALLFTNCTAKKEFIALPEKFQSEIKTTEVYIEENNKKMQADVESSNISTYTGGGLLFALVDCAIMAHREECANEAMLDLQKELEASNFHEIFKNQLIQTLKNTSWFHVRHINYVKELNEEAYREIFKKVDSDSLLTVKFIYKLNPQLNVLKGTLYLTLYPASLKMRKMVNIENPLETPIFKLHVSAAEALPNTGQDIQENAKMWAQNHGALLKKGLENIIHEVMVRLDKALKNPNHLPEI